MEEYLSEKEQWEWLKTQARDNAPAVVLALALVIAAVAGWRWWQGNADADRIAASELYAQMVKSLEHGERTQALAALNTLERDHSRTPYVDQARLLAARVHVDQGELDRAATELDTVMRGSKDKDLALIARARLARVQIAQGKPDAALVTLSGVSGDVGAFAANYHEVRGDALLAKGDRAGALGEYRLARAGGGEQPADLLDLKIGELGGTASATPAPGAPLVHASAPSSGAAVAR